jgi:2-polyprenyl-3-methyl-5-hydroxy-6-metoxy-1,4-benzoquinol methylase
LVFQLANYQNTQFQFSSVYNSVTHQIRMDYIKQQRYLQRSRIQAACGAIALLLAAFLSWLVDLRPRAGTTIVFGLVTVALAVGLCYLPNYLQLTVNPQRQLSWAIKVRWRIIAAVGILGMVLASGWPSRVVVLITVAWLLVAAIAARQGIGRAGIAWLWISEFAAIAVLLLNSWLDPLLGALLLAAAAHLAIVSSTYRPFRWASVTVAASLGILGVPLYRASARPGSYGAFAALISITALVTAWFVHRARKQNLENKDNALHELADFTGYPAEKIEHLWAISNRQLAENWQRAAIAADDRERLAQWYRDNSELYLFAISGYNLEYKRILSNLNVLKLGRGACLDYGAGNGEIVLELARRGHPATYYDVDGVTMKFARRRAAQQKLPVSFFCMKDQLAAATQGAGFDTIFSFDVLEHLPDLPGELNFLTSLLAPGGLFVFDVPAGSTKAHPMHLDHNLNVFAFMEAKGLRDERSLALKLPFKKEEKYAYRKP